MGENVTEKEVIDNVNHPSHYEKSCSIECIDAMRLAYGEKAVLDFCICNAFKYIWRHKAKNGTEDLDKAAWYIRYGCELRQWLVREGLVDKEKESAINARLTTLDYILGNCYKAALGKEQSDE